MVRGYDDMSEPAGAVAVHGHDDTSEPARAGSRIDVGRWTALAAAVLRDEGVDSGELGLHFVDRDAMADLNGTHMGASGPTDVLAFGIDGAGNGSSPGPVRLLGDVVVCPGYAAAQAPRHAGEGHDGSLDDELGLLVVHGVLHIVGYDHADGDEAAAMQARERELLAAHHRRP